MKNSSLVATGCACMIALLLFAGCTKKSSPAPKPTPPAPKAIANGTYQIVLDQYNLGGTDTTFQTRAMPDCEPQCRYTFMNGNYTLVDACDGTTSSFPYTYDTSTGELKIFSKDGYAYESTIKDLSATGFLWTEPQGNSQQLRYKMKLVSD